MKGYRFYEELEHKNRKGEKSQGNVVALFLDWDTGQPLYNPDYSMSCMSAVYFESNSPVCCSNVSREYLDKKARHISEEKARAVHPELFKHLERTVPWVHNEESSK